tara:strand:- start:3099 stop:4274 length:1176 start_codon:yes stop_codon:yes gene_type:complete
MSTELKYVKKIIEVPLTYPEILGANSQIIKYIDTVHDLNILGCRIRPVWCFVEKGGEGVNIDIQVDVPDHVHDVVIQFRIYALNLKQLSSLNKNMAKDFFKDGIVSSEHYSEYEKCNILENCLKMLSKNECVFRSDARNGGEPMSGSGPFSIPNTRTKLLTKNNLESSNFQNEEGIIRFVVVLNFIKIRMDPKYILTRFMEIKSPELFKSELESFSEHVKRLIKNNKKLAENINVKDTLTDGILIAKKGDKEYHTLNKLNDELKNKSDILRAKLCAENERTSLLKMQLRNNNITNLLKMFDSEQDLENLRSQISSLTYEKMYELFLKLSKIRMLFIEEIQESMLCPICFDSEKNISVQPCGHTFCGVCVEDTNNLCPACKQPALEYSQIIF